MATYKIKAGDNLSTIAANNNTTVDVISKLNNISDPNKIYAGADLTLPDATPPAVTSTTLPQSQMIAPGEQTVEQRNAAFKDAGGSPSVIPPPTSGPISTSDLARATSLPDPTTYATTNSGKNLSDMVSSVGKTALTSNQQVVDSLRKEQERLVTMEKDAAQAKVDQVSGKIAEVTSSTAAQDALDATMKKFDVENKIQQYTEIQNKIVSAQEALNMGLIYEADRPARMQLITGRSSSLQKQGLATIGALQATAEVIKGNIDLAKSYAETTINAINTDNQNSMSALKTLLTLYNDKLVDLTKEEHDVVNARITAIEDQNKQIESDKQDLLDYMTKYPSAFLKGGVTLLDTKETALQKMLPVLSADERTKFNADIAAKLKTGSTESDKDGPAADKQQMLQLKANGMTYQEALNAFSDTLSTSWINAVYRQDNTVSDTSGENQLKNQYYSQFLDANGKVKPGYTVTIDSKGNPVVEQDKSNEPGWISKLFSAVNPFN